MESCGCGRGARNNQPDYRARQEAQVEEGLAAALDRKPLEKPPRVTIMQTFLNVGVDVAKDAVVVSCAAQSFPVHRVANQRTLLLAWLKSLPASNRIGLEIRGLYKTISIHVDMTLPSAPAFTV